MHIHRFEKIWLVASLLLIVLFIGTVAYGAVGLGIDMVGDDEQIDPSALDEDDRFSEPRVEPVAGSDDEYEVYVQAKRFSFEPDPIRVPENSRVTFYITSPDVIHGFEVVGTNVNTMVIPGEVSVITVEFDEPGEYGIICNEYCGGAHHMMEGKLEVVPEEEFDRGDDE